MQTHWLNAGGVNTKLNINYSAIKGMDYILSYFSLSITMDSLPGTMHTSTNFYTKNQIIDFSSIIDFYNKYMQYNVMLVYGVPYLIDIH